MNQKKFSIGQVVYILSARTQNIIPAMIVEEQTIQTLQGVNVFWKVLVGFGEKQKIAILDSSKLGGEIYTSLDDIKNILTKRLTQYVEELIITTKKRETVWYGKLKNENKSTKADSTPKHINNNKLDPESFLEDLDSLTKNDNSFENKFTDFTEEVKQQELTQRLKDSIMPTRDELIKNIDQVDEQIDHETNGNKIVIDGPDGKPIVANIKAIF